MKLSGLVLKILAASLCAVALQASGDAGERDVLRVCADPEYMPFSSKQQAGFENKIAEIIAADLGARVEYYWFPQRMGFIRNTLRQQDPQSQEYRCDVVMGVPKGFELAITTRPWYRSTYALVYAKGGKLDGVMSSADLLALDEARKDALRIGINERSPGAVWLAKYDMFNQMVPYVAQAGDPSLSPGELEVLDVLAGKLDGAILWGPIAAYAATLGKEKSIHVQVIPMTSEPGVLFHYAISAGVRFGEGEWRDQLNEVLDRNADKIMEVLKEYGVPLVDEHGAALS
ncbi:MAG: quinoprotein dehydrogenase-associated putative ABC transporter substrate-binding protein [Gammaproteobacteria bacterium]